MEGLIHGTLVAMSQLCELERDKTVREVANCDISVASQWIIRCGMELYKVARDRGPLKDDPGMAVGHGPLCNGPLYKGPLGLCLERWLFWKSRLSRVRDEVDEEVAKMAQQAVGEMERAEKAMRKRAMDLSTGEMRYRLSKSRRTS